LPKFLDWRHEKDDLPLNELPDSQKVKAPRLDVSKRKKSTKKEAAAEAAKKPLY
jgi:hypothetical protein